MFLNIHLGRGGKKGTLESCPACQGRGFQIHTQQLGPGFLQRLQTSCKDCQGAGERINAKDRCRTCQGNKVRPT